MNKKSYYIVIVIALFSAMFVVFNRFDFGNLRSKSELDQLSSNVDIYLGHGIGNITFGMDQKHVLESLGEPDEIGWEGRYYQYFIKGFNIAFLTDGGVFQIECYTKEGLVGIRPEINTFQGAIDGCGIKMRATITDIEKAIGAPEKIFKNKNLLEVQFPSKGLMITLSNDKIIRFVITEPREMTEERQR